MLWGHENETLDFCRAKNYHNVHAWTNDGCWFWKVRQGLTCLVISLHRRIDKERMSILVVIPNFLHPSNLCRIVWLLVSHTGSSLNKIWNGLTVWKIVCGYFFFFPNTFLWDIILFLQNYKFDPLFVLKFDFDYSII